MTNVTRGIGEAIWANTDSLTKWIQVIALCGAAWWTFTNYSVADKPSLEPHLRVDAIFGSIKPGWEPGTCRVAYNLTVKNEGKVSFDLVRIHFRAWHNEIPKAKPESEATFVDAEDFSQGTPFLDDTISRANLLRHYVPGQELNQGFTWILRRQKPGITTFIVDVSAKSGERETVSRGRFWRSQVCDDNGEISQE